MERWWMAKNVSIVDAGADLKIVSYLRAVIKHSGSDIHFKAGAKPRVRVAGQIRSLSGEPLSNEEIEDLVFAIMPDEAKERYAEKGAVDFAFEIKNEDRFRINVYRQRGQTSIAARRVTRTIPTFEELHLPPSLQKLAEFYQGLILLSGVTGSGKSTTIAAMLEHINRTRAEHIITIEDPIEYLFEDKKSFINQREVGIDVQDFHDALKYLMREDPDVVLIGEIRDGETVSAGLQAAETGHLVFGTIHSSTTAQTITRILDLFPEEERGLVRQSLVFNLRAIVSLKLLPSIKPDCPRVPVAEVLIVNAVIRKLIEEGRDSDITDVIKNSYHEGMQDFNESLRRLVEEEWIDIKLAYEVSPNPDELKMRLKGISTSRTGIIG